MTRARTSKRRTAQLASCLLATIATVSAAELRAQICAGTPSSGGIEYSYQRLNNGGSNGGMATFAGSHVAVRLGFRARSIDPNLSGQEGDFRLAIVLGSSRFKVCPGIRVVYQHDTWDPETGLSLTSHAVAAGGGVGVGYELPVYKDLSIIPFGSVGYEYNVIAFSLKATNSETDVTADTLSGLGVEYGAIAHYRLFYGGFAAARRPKQEGLNPSNVRWIIGVTFHGSSVADRPKKP